MPSLEPKEAHSLPTNQSQTALYERYSRIIFGYLRLHIHSPEDAEDLLLDVFLAALEQDNLTAFSPGEQLAWLRRVAHNKLMNAYRRASRSPHITLNEIEGPTLEEESPEYLLLRQEAWKQVQTSLKALPALQQHILQLRYGDGLRCSEIALLLNKREEAVRKLLSRSILRLRHIYQQIEGESIGSTFKPGDYTQYNPNDQPRFTNHDLNPRAFSVVQDLTTKQYDINFAMQGTAVNRFQHYTANAIGHTLTVTLDKNVLDSAIIQSDIPGIGTLSGNFTQQQANALASILKSNVLPIELKQVS